MFCLNLNKAPVKSLLPKNDSGNGTLVKRATFSLLVFFSQPPEKQGNNMFQGLFVSSIIRPIELKKMQEAQTVRSRKIIFALKMAIQDDKYKLL